MDQLLEKLYREIQSKGRGFSFTSFLIGTLVGTGIGIAIYYFGEELVGQCFAFVITSFTNWVASSWARPRG